MTSIQLREYQSDLIAALGSVLRRRVRRVLLVLPPGGGKTVIAAFIAQAFKRKEQSTYFNCHRGELMKQTSGTFTNCGLAHGFVAAGVPLSTQDVMVCSVDTLKNRLDKIKPPRVCLWDECHHIGAEGWAKIMKAWRNTIHIGLTGTPWRLDGTGLGKFFDEMIMGPTAGELIEMGDLAPYRIFAPSAPDMKGVRKQMGEFAKGETEKRMREPKLTGDIVSHWLRRANGVLTVGYAMTVPHSMHMVELFNAAGIPAAHLDGGTDRGERKEVIRKYADGELRVLWNVGLFGEGFDLSAWAGKPVTIDATILANPTMSLSKYLQESMRCMRPDNERGKVGLIFDHAGNSNRHGFPDDERDWSLDGRQGGAGGNAANGPPPPFTCDGCFSQLRRPIPKECPYCNKRLIADFVAPEVKDEELEEKSAEDRAEVRRRIAMEQAACKTLDELVALGRKRGHRNPVKWAQHVLSGRRAKAA